MADGRPDWERILDVRQRPVALADDPGFVWDNPSTLRREFVELDQSEGSVRHPAREMVRRRTPNPLGD